MPPSSDDTLRHYACLLLPLSYCQTPAAMLRCQLRHAADEARAHMLADATFRHYAAAYACVPRRYVVVVFSLHYFAF